MNWNAIAAIAELSGALGVVLSLVYLAREVRNNAAQTNEAVAQTRQAAAQAVVNGFNSVMADLAHAEHASIFARGVKGLDHLGDYGELVQFSGRMFTIFRPWEQLYYHYKSQTIDEWVWLSVERMMSDTLRNPGVMEWWKARGVWFSPEFRNHVNPMASREQRLIELDYEIGSRATDLERG